MKTLTKYDDEFKREQSIKWDPWVGEDFDKTRTLIIGECTYVKEGEGWSPDWREECENERTPNRGLIGENAKGGLSPFSAMPEMFGDAFTKGSDPNIAFWSSVAFFNYYQTAVDGPRGERPTGEKLECDRAAAKSIVEILKPELVIIWSVGLFDSEYSKLYEDSDDVGQGLDKIGGHPQSPCPRVARSKNPDSVIVGIEHPSPRQRGYFPAKEWYQFLANYAVTKDSIAKLEKHLRAL